MSKKILIAIVAVMVGVMCFCVPSFAAKGPSDYTGWSVSPKLGFLTGEFRREVKKDTVRARKVNLPIDTLLAGVELRYDFSAPYAIEIGIDKSLSSFAGFGSDNYYTYSMGTSTYVATDKFQGDAMMSMYGGYIKWLFKERQRDEYGSEITLRKLSGELANMTPTMGAGYRLEHYSYDINDPVTVTSSAAKVYREGTLMTSDLLIHGPFVSLGFDWLLNGRNTIFVDLSLGFVIYSEDTSNRVEGYTSSVKGTGKEIRFTINSRHELSDEWSFGFFGEFAGGGITCGQNTVYSTSVVQNADPVTIALNRSRFMLKATRKLGTDLPGISLF